MSARSEVFDVAIVGGGVIGMACAELLSRDSRLRICVIERDRLGRAASWAGGGMLTPLPPDRCPDAQRSLLAQSLSLYPTWCARLRDESGIDPEYWECGAIYEKPDGQRIEYPRMAQVRNPRLLKALAETLRRRGVRLLEQTTADDWQVDNGVVQGVRCGSSVIRAGHSILAAGAWSAALGADGVAPAKGQMLLLRAAPGELTRMHIADDVYLVPRRDGQILVGSTLEDAGFDIRPTIDARAQLLARAAALWPAAARLPVIGHWSGLRPRGAGEAPLLGAHPRLSALWMATAHFRLGITLAPGSAQHLADAMGPILRLKL